MPILTNLRRLGEMISPLLHSDSPSLGGHRVSRPKVIIVKTVRTKFLMTDKNYEDGPHFKNIDIEEIFKGLREYNQKFLHYIKENDITRSIDLQWTDTDKLVKTSPENIIFNFVTHSAYHRDQLAIYLRSVGIETITETDFNPYILLARLKIIIL